MKKNALLKFISTFLIGLIFITCSAQEKRQTWVFLGDSNLWIGLDSKGREQTWRHYLVEQAGNVDGYSMARSGATITNTANTVVDPDFYSELLNDNNVLLAQVERLKRDVAADSIPSPDCIFIYGGTNDAWFAKKRPGIFDKCADSDKPSEATSLRSSLNLIIRELRKSFPQASLVVVTPPQNLRSDPENYDKVVTTMIDTALANGLDVVDLSSAWERTECEQFTSDGVHTNYKGAQKIAEIMLDIFDETAF